MSTLARFTERDEILLDVLATKTRLLSQRQVSEHWFGGDLANTRRRMRQHVERGLVQKVIVRARPLPPMSSPLAQWKPNVPAPDFAKVAYACSSRWRRRPVRSCTAYVATAVTARHFGGRATGEVKHELQVTHDLGVAQIWLHLDRSAPAWADAWRGEDVMAGTRIGQKLPDAFIVNDSGTTLCVIEFGGAYDKQRILEFHEDCASRDLPYQLW